MYKCRYMKRNYAKLWEKWHLRVISPSFEGIFKQWHNGMIDTTARSHTYAKSYFHTPSEYMPNCLCNFSFDHCDFFPVYKWLCYQWEDFDTFATVPCMAEAPVVALWVLGVQTNKSTRQEKLTRGLAFQSCVMRAGVRLVRICPRDLRILTMLFDDFT